MNPYSKWIGLVLIGAILGTARANLPTDPAEYRKWEKEKLEWIAERKACADESAHADLANSVYKLSLPTNQEREGRPAFNAAREALISFPDHADFLRRSLEQTLQAEFAEARHEPTAATPFYDQNQLIVVMGELRTPSCIALLGELLNDERDPWKDKRKADPSRPSCNWVYAVSTLGKLQIDNVAVIEIKNGRDVEAAREQWKLWFNQLKAGTRTYRFKGDPQEYNLQGPVSSEAAPAKETK